MLVLILILVRGAHPYLDKFKACFMERREYNILLITDGNTNKALSKTSSCSKIYVT
jgi:hypothetical protein